MRDCAFGTTFERESLKLVSSLGEVGVHLVLHTVDMGEGWWFKARTQHTHHAQSGRPNTIRLISTTTNRDIHNYTQCLNDWRWYTPSSPLIVKGANLFITAEPKPARPFTMRHRRGYFVEWRGFRWPQGSHSCLWKKSLPKWDGLFFQIGSRIVISRGRNLRRSLARSQSVSQIISNGILIAAKLILMPCRVPHVLLCFPNLDSESIHHWLQSGIQGGLGWRLGSSVGWSLSWGFRWGLAWGLGWGFRWNEQLILSFGKTRS